MFSRVARVLLASVLSMLALPVLADDCTTAAKIAMSTSGRTPVTITVTKTDAQGKKTTTRQVQTVANKFVQTENGKWYAMNIAIKDLIDDLDTRKLTCQRSGSDVINGESVSTYEVQEDADEVMRDDKIWVSSRNLIVKTEGNIQGAHYTMLYDYAHVTPPADAISMGGNERPRQ